MSSLIKNTSPTAAEKKSISAISAELAALDELLEAYRAPLGAWVADNTRSHYACDESLLALQESPTAATAKAHYDNLLFRKNIAEFSEEIRNAINISHGALSARLKPIGDAILDREIADLVATHQTRLTKLEDAGLDAAEKSVIEARHKAEIDKLNGQRGTIQADPHGWLLAHGLAA